MADQMAHIVDASYGTHNNVGRDQIINYDAFSRNIRCGQSPSSLSLNDAPIDHLSSHFTGRKEELDHIGKVFGMGHAITPTRYAIFGLPGMGKTQLALQYAKLSYHQRKYSVIFWISGATVEKLNQGLAKVLTLVDHPDRDHPDQSVRLISARRWLEEANANGVSEWLLVLDNVSPEAISFLREHLPRQNSSGNILLTTRTAVVAQAVVAVAGQQHEVFELRAPDIKDAANQFLREAGINMSDPLPVCINKAESLAKCIGCLPLAISQAASFAKQSDKKLDDVLALYQSKHKFEVRLNI